MADSRVYKNIFKTTFLFGFVQVFNIIMKVLLNKVVAVLLGTSGIGVIGLFNTAINLLKTGAGLGISQSAVRDVSEANVSGDVDRFSYIISLVNRIIIFTSLLGVIATIIASPLLSRWSFGNNRYTISFIWLSIAVGLNILSEGQLAVLKGMRQLRALAKANMVGSVVGLISAVPFYYFGGEGGIVPSLIIVAFASLFFSNYYVRKIRYVRIYVAIKETFTQSSSMVKMGCALMLVSFIGFLFDLIIASYISNKGGLAVVGLYNAGTTIITSYFGIIITAMSTDYYPRISAVHNDNIKLEEEMNNQSETGLIMLFPIVVLFVFLSSFFIKILYSDEFVDTNEYTDYAMLGTIIIVVSNCMGMILLAKQAAKIFIWSVVFQRVLLIGVYLFFYNFLGLRGLGFAYILTGVLHLLLMSFILSINFNIKLSRKVIRLLLIIVLTTIVTIWVRQIDFNLVKYSVGAILLLAVSAYSYWYMKSRMNIDLAKIFKNMTKRCRIN